MRYQDIPSHYQRQMPVFPASVQHYIIMNQTSGEQGFMDDNGGRATFGDDDWEMILNGIHPEYDAEPLEITLH